MIEAQNISKSFSGTTVIEDISCSFEDGKTSLIIGSSGTGKSVLLKCLVGLVQPEEGKVFYDGRDFLHCSKDVKRRIRKEIGMLFQGNALFDSKTVGQNVAFPMEVMDKATSKKEREQRTEEVLERVGLQGISHLMPSEISGGMKKRVGLARAIVLNPRYLFVDEPNSGLDPQTSIVIDELISDITQEFNITTIIVTHDMNSVLGIGQHIIFLHKGHLLWSGSKDRVMDSNVPELNDFVFANKTMTLVRENYGG